MSYKSEIDKTIVFSVRMKETIKEKLELESELNNINTNTLVNQIITKYLKWDRFGKDLGSVYITKRFLRGVFTELNDEQVIRLATSISGPGFRDAVIFMHSDLNYENIIITIKDLLENSDYQFRHTSDNGDKFVIHHGMGTRWPLYFLTMLESILEEVSYGIKEITANEESVSFTIISTV